MEIGGRPLGLKSKERVRLVRKIYQEAVNAICDSDTVNADGSRPTFL